MKISSSLRFTALTAVFILIIGVKGYSASILNAYHNKYLGYFLKGDLKAALALNTKTLKKCDSDYEKSILKYELAFIKASLGYYADARSAYAEAEVLRKKFPANSNENISGLLEAVYFHRVFDNYNAMEAILAELKSNEKESTKRNILGLQTEVAIGRRDYVNGLQYYERYKSELENPYAPEKNYLNRTASAQLNSFYYSESVYISALVSRILLEKGDYETNSKINAHCSKFISDKGLYKTIAEFHYQFLLGETALIKKQMEEAEKAYKNSSVLLPLHKSHYSYEGTERYAYVLCLRGKGKFAEKIYTDFLISFAKFPGDASKNIFYRYKIEADLAISKNEWYKAKERLNFVVQDTFILPKFHPHRLLIINQIYKIDLYTGFKEVNSGVNSAEDRINSMEEIAIRLYGKDSPYLSLLNVSKACYLVDNTHRLLEARKIFENDFSKVLLSNYNPQQIEFYEFYTHYSKLERIVENYPLALELQDKADKILLTNNLKTNISELKSSLHKGRIHFENEDPFEAKKYFDNGFPKLYELKTEEIDQELAGYFKLKAFWELFNDNFRESKKSIKKEEEISNYLRTEKKADIPDNSLFWFDYYSKLTQITHAGENLLPNKVFVKFESKNLFNQYEILIRFAEYYLHSGDYLNCEKFIMKTLEVAEAVYGKQTSKYHNALRIKSRLALSMGDYLKAQELSKLVIDYKIKNSKGFSSSLAILYTEWAEVKQLNGASNKDVEAIYLKALEIFKIQIGEQRINYGNTCIKIANLYITEKRFDEAKKLLETADGLIAEVLDKKNTIKADIKVKLGDIALAQGELNTAERSYKQALKIFQVDLDKSHPSIFHTESRLAKLYFLNKEDKKCKEIIFQSQQKYRNYIEHYFPFLTEHERLKFWNSIKGEFNFYNVFFLNNLADHEDYSGEIYNNTLLTKAILLNSSLKTREQILNSNDNNLKKTFVLYTSKKELLLSSSNMTPQEMVENGINQEVLEKEIAELEKELSANSVMWENLNEIKVYEWKHIKDKLKDGEAAVEIVRLNHVSINPSDSILYLALIITNKSEFPQAVVLKEGTRLESRFIKYYRNTMKSGIKDDLSYSCFFSALAPHLQNKTNIYLSVDGVYNQLNIETLQDSNNDYVIDKYNIVLLSNTKELARPKTQQKNVAQKTVYLFGNPTFYSGSKKGNIEQLPGTDKEVKNISKIFENKDWNVKLFVDTSASEKNIKSVKSPAIVHIATHGFFKELNAQEKLALENNPAYDNPLLRSGLLLYNAGEIINQNNLNYNSKEGILTAYEAMNMNLNHTNLIVMSACETGLGEIQAGEGVFGLQRTFFVAGAESLVMSLFKVSDEVTQKLMTKFYGHINNGKSIRAAFLEAKKEIKTEYPEPKYWGSFVMIGVSDASGY